MRIWAGVHRSRVKARREIPQRAADRCGTIHGLRKIESEIDTAPEEAPLDKVVHFQFSECSKKGVKEKGREERSAVPKWEKQTWITLCPTAATKAVWAGL